MRQRVPAINGMIGFSTYGVKLSTCKAVAQHDGGPTESSLTQTECIQRDFPVIGWFLYKRLLNASCLSFQSVLSRQRDKASKRGH